MSRLRSLTQLDTTDPEKLKRDLGRLVQELDDELDAAKARMAIEWPEVTALQRGSITAKMGQLVRVDTLPGAPAPHVYMPEAKTTDIGSRIGVSVNATSPTCLAVAHSVGSQKINFTGTVATLVASALVIRAVTWTGQTWELGY